MSDLSFDRAAARDGIVNVLPLVIPGMPFGFVLGLFIQTSGLPQAPAWASSFIVFAGSSQLAGLTLLSEGAAGVFIVVSIFLINSRHIVYSAAMRAKFAPYPTWFRFIGPYFLIDQIFALLTTSDDLEDKSARYWMWHYLGAGVFTWSLWQITTTLGLFVGDFVDEAWMLNFAVPIVFLGLMVLSIKDRPGLLAAITAGVIAVVVRGLPQGSGLMLAIITGMAVGVMTEQRGTSDPAHDEVSA